MKIDSKISVEYKTIVLNSDGTVHKEREFKRNLILDSGLNMINAHPFAACNTACSIGTGTKPVKRDSGTTTFTRSGFTVTSSAGFFDASDVGRILKFDTGQEMRVTVFTSATQVTVDQSGVLSASEGTVWYVNETTNEVEVKRTVNYSTGSGECGTTFSVDTYTHQRTFIFSVETAPITYREIGWSPFSSLGAALFGRDVIPGSGDSLSAGQQYKVIVRLLVTLNPSVATSQSNVGTGGFNTSGQFKFEYINNNFCFVDSGGNTNFVASNRNFEPYSTETAFGYFTGTLNLISGIVTTGFVESNGPLDKRTVKSAYADGSFFVDKVASVSVSEMNSTDITGICFGYYAGSQAGRCFTIKFDSPQTKLNTHTLTVTLRQSWGRSLAN
jgi:hypothetical protein